MAAIAKTQTTSTASPSAGSPAPGASTTSTAETAAAVTLPTSQSDAFERALAGDLERHRAASEKDGKQATGQTTDSKASDGTEKREATTTVEAKPGDTTEAGTQGEQEQAEQTTTTEGEEGATTQAETAAVEADLSKEVDAEQPPKGMENVPKALWKRFNSLTKENATLKAQSAQGAIQITPTPANPLADVGSTKDLQTRVNAAQAVANYVKQNPDALKDGARIPRADGSIIELTADQVKARHAKAEVELAAAPEAKARIAWREENKPWETAAKFEPNLFVKDTPANTFMTGLVSECPELRTKLADSEIILGCAARGYQMLQDEQSGKAQWVRMELDEKGKPAVPTAAGAKTGNGGTLPKVKPISTAKPALSTGHVPSAAEALAALPATATADQRLDAALDAAFAAAKAQNQARRPAA